MACVGFARREAFARSPFIGGGAEAASLPTPNQADLQDAKIRVLLGDDNKAFLRAATEFLQRHDELVVVGAICGGEQVLVRAQELRAQVILVGLDSHGQTGLETISCLRDTLPDLGIIALTLLEGHAFRQAAMADGADDLVRKAELTTELLPVIWRVIQAKRFRVRIGRRDCASLVEMGQPSPSSKTGGRVCQDGRFSFKAWTVVYVKRNLKASGA